MGRLDGTINNTNIEQNAILIIINTDPKLITNGNNNNTDDKVDAGVSDVFGSLNANIKDMNAKPTTSGSKNNTNNEADRNVSDVLGVAIKDTNAEPTTNRANNDIDGEVDMDVFRVGVISKTDVELNTGGLSKADTIIEKQIYESNLF